MAEKPVPTASLLWIVVVVLLGAYAWWLSGQLDVSRQQLKESQLREQQLVQQIQELVVRAGTQECPPDA